MIKKSDAWVQRGDIMTSSRHISTVFLYRPTEDRIVWLKSGPWTTQHDVDYLGEGVFSVFGNDYVRGYGPLREHSNIYFYDMKTDTTTTPFEAVFKKHRLYTKTQGLHRILDNGDAFVEIQNTGELMRISPTEIRWKYVSSIGEGEIGIVHWCRYFYKVELDLSWIPEH